MGKTNPEPGTPGSIHVGLLVDDIQAAPAKLAAGGAKSIGEPKQGSGGTFVHFQDPDGNDIYLWQM